MDAPPARSPASLILIAAACGLGVACSPKQDAPLPVTATSLPASEVGDSMAGGTSTPVNGQAAPGQPTGALASGAFGGAAADTAQTAALSPLANANGTIPASPGVGPPGGVVASAVGAPGSGVSAGPGVASPSATARAANTAGVPASGRVAAPVTPVGGALGAAGVSGSPAPTAAAGSAPSSSVGVAATSGRAAPTVAAGAVSAGAPR